MRGRSRHLRAKSRSTRPCVLPTWVIHLVLCMSAIRPLAGRAADYTEITVELNSTWRSQTLTNHHTFAATCIVGSNHWFFSGDFLKNAKADFWFIGTNVVEYRTITSSMYFERAKEIVSEKILGQSPSPGSFVHSYPRAGETFIVVHSSPSGRPAFHGVGGVVWLAFCSGDYLKRLDRQIPMPIGPSEQAFGYTDETVLFDDPFGLPKSVKLFATNGMLACEYKVLAATNFLGRRFPLQFRVMQLGQPADGGVHSSSTTDLGGRVMSIRSGKWRELPNEVRKKLGP